MSIAFIDLKQQQARIRAKIDAGLSTVLDHGAYIMGPEVGALEARLGEWTACTWFAPVVRAALGLEKNYDADMADMLARVKYSALSHVRNLKFSIFLRMMLIGCSICYKISDF